MTACRWACRWSASRIAGHDPADPVTAEGVDSIPDSYTEFLDADGLEGARVGVIRQLSNRENADPEVLEVFEQALVDLWSNGTEVIDPIDLPQLANLGESTEDGVDTMWCSRFKFDLNNYLAFESRECRSGSARGI